VTIGGEGGIIDGERCTNGGGSCGGGEGK